MTKYLLCVALTFNDLEDIIQSEFLELQESSIMVAPNNYIEDCTTNRASLQIKHYFANMPPRRANRVRPEITIIAFV